MAISVKGISTIALVCKKCGQASEYDLRSNSQAHQCRNPGCPASRQAPQLPENGDENMSLQMIRQALRKAIDSLSKRDFAFEDIALK